jgi:hypothetical protein
MARLARVVIPGMPHHVTQRGNRRQQTFFNDGDYAAYLELMAQWCGEEGVLFGDCPDFCVNRRDEEDSPIFVTFSHKNRDSPIFGATA